MKQLSNIKVFGTIVLENVPQLMLQLLYSSERGITASIGIAFFASILSVIATLLSYLIDRNGNDIKPVQYYLTIQCQRAPVSDRNITMRGKITAIGSAASESSSKHNHLTSEETLNIMNNKGKTQCLSDSIASLFEIQPKNIEIGSTLCHNTGATIHVVHMVYQSELDIMEQELSEDGMTINPYFYTQKLFISLEKEITELLLNHFKLNMHEFIVLYDDFAGLQRRKMGRGIISKRYVSNRELGQKVMNMARLDADDNKPKDDAFKLLLKDYLYDGDVTIKTAQLYQMINTLNGEELNVDNDEESINLSITHNERNPNRNDEAIAVEMVNMNRCGILNDGDEMIEEDDEFSTSNRL